MSDALYLGFFNRQIGISGLFLEYATIFERIVSNLRVGLQSLFLSISEATSRCYFYSDGSTFLGGWLSVLSSR